SIIRSGVRGSSSLPCLSESIDAGLKVSIRASADSLAGTPKAQNHETNRETIAAQTGQTRANPVQLAEQLIATLLP
ncbi:hypothetical protein, partial [Sphingomonas koreensis]